MQSKAYNMSLSLKLTRTANAGVLMEIDGVRILLDGVCEQLPPYLGTPAYIRKQLVENMPDVVAFTHKHPDHYDEDYAKSYTLKTLRSVYGPESLPFLEINGVEISAYPTRHIGKANIEHISLVIKGSSTVWFVGDASPLSLKCMEGEDKPDLLIVPFAYAITPSAWRMTASLGAKKILLLHMPPRDNDIEGLWDMVENTVESGLYTTLDIGQTINL